MRRSLLLAAALVIGALSTSTLPAQPAATVSSVVVEVPPTTDWRSWSPTLTNLNPSELGIVDGRYRYSGGRVDAELAITLGAGAVVSTNPSFTLPTPAVAPKAAFSQYAGAASIYSASNVYPAAVVADNVSGATFRVFAYAPTSSGYLLLGPAAPAPWSAGSSISLRFSYEPADPTPPSNTFAAVGDSITAWQPYQNAYDYAGSWANHIATPDLAFSGGWARGSASTVWMAGYPQPTHADAVVILAGINDIGQGIPLATTLANLDTIVAKAGAPVVVLSALAPYNANPAAVTAANLAYEALAATRGWHYVDPWGPVRTAEGRYITGASTDGVHPTPATSLIAATAYRAALEGLL